MAWALIYYHVPGDAVSEIQAGSKLSNLNHDPIDRA